MLIGLLKNFSAILDIGQFIVVLKIFCPLKQSNELLSKEKWMNAKRKMDECESPRNINKSTVSLFVQPMTLRIWRLFPHIIWTLTLTLTLNFGLWWLQVQMTLQTWTNLNFKTPLSLWCFIKKGKILKRSEDFSLTSIELENPFIALMFY